MRKKLPQAIARPWKWNYLCLTVIGGILGLSAISKKDAERQYLLGTLSQDEQIRVEDEFFANDSHFEELEMAEEELIDDYVRDELSPLERRQFETKLLTSQRIIDRINFARALARKAGEQPQSAPDRDDFTPFLAKQKTKWWQGVFGQPVVFPAALAACVALLLIGGGIFFFSWRQLRIESERLAAEREQLQKQKESTEKQLLDQQIKNEQMAAAVQKELETLEERRRLDAGQKVRNQSNTGGLSGTIVSLVLSPGLVRDSNAQQQATIGAGVATVQLELLMQSNDYRSYRVTITDALGRTVVTRSGLTSRRTATGFVVGLSIPAKNLSSANYVVTVRGRLPNGSFEDVEDYVFRISK